MRLKISYRGWLLWCLIPLWGLFSCKQTQETTLINTPTTDSVFLNRFAPQMEQFAQMDADSFPGTGIIVFTGSSSIRKWDSLTQDMAPLPVVNRGFGGAHTVEVTHWAERVILPYQPKVIVFYCGENDISNDSTGSALPLTAFSEFIHTVKPKLPGVKILYLSMKPSLLREAYWPKFQEGNQQLKQLIDKLPGVEYIDVSTPMLDESGQIREDIFLPDSLHMNLKGYEIWTKVVRPAVEKAWTEAQTEEN